MKANIIVKVIAVVTLFANTGLAQDVKDMVPKDEAIAKSTMNEDGWSMTAKVSASGSMSRHSRVVGQTEGTSYLLGANLEGGLNYKSGQNEVLNTLIFNQGTSKVPNIEHYIKTSDTLKWESLYLYNLESWPTIAPFVKASAETSVFQNTLYSSTPANFITPDGATAGESFRLTDGLNPMIFKLSAGAFYTPIKKEDMELRFSLGVGHLNVKAEGYSIASDDLATGTRTVTLNELDDFNQTGLVAGANLKGSLDKRTGYDLGYEMFYPLAFDDEVGSIKDPSAADLINHDFYAKLNTKLTEYFSLNYEYRWKKVPQLLDNSQQSHLVGVSVSYILF